MTDSWSPGLRGQLAFLAILFGIAAYSGYVVKGMDGVKVIGLAVVASFTIGGVIGAVHMLYKEPRWRLMVDD